MIKILRPSEFKSMPWKNGLGVTAQIAIEPSEARFPEDRFDWRLSAATIRSANEFSLFPGYRRCLTVWKGAGLCLNGRNLLPLEVFEFNGEDPIECSLLADGGRIEPVEDFGIIYDPQKSSVSMSIVQPEALLVLKDAVQFLFCVEGALALGDATLNPGSIARIEQEADLNLHVTSATLIWTYKIFIHKSGAMTRGPDRLHRRDRKMADSRTVAAAAVDAKTRPLP